MSVGSVLLPHGVPWGTAGSVSPMGRGQPRGECFWLLSPACP